MLTGKQLFAGETVSDTLAAVLRSEIDWNLLPANTPATIRALLSRCLNKDRKERLRDIGEARIAISQYLADPASASIQKTVAGADRHRRLERLAWVSAVVLLIAASSILGVIYYRKIHEPSQVTRLEYTLPDDQQLRSTVNEPFLGVSPDGRELFYRNGEAVIAVAVDTAPDFKPGQPEEIFRGAYFSSDAGSSKSPMWDISPDGKRFLAMKDAGSAASTAGGPRKINIVINWFEELKRKAPAR